ncbi:peptidase C19 family ubiquitinyl hydrolase [Naegleria gruberi]|uniref:Peptidase C19 family ubiquitinyl hydrolase n=1 Tax=Naegleria gruberi TaxID=5762 RepID=D2V7T5_NAEGR|nr:peptidase C19 family ubiquitinyl hydrolase [Naegleria gruberi]EFC46926.1 peptidase C19 family ubiquitinyl hydrolase [Naegleria gruberi]|eukprot:XP_002679670.1 peptidase C19 family ubiquitinyl hydrolase [Naegleria gruberi strain NEG-M]
MAQEQKDNHETNHHQVNSDAASAAQVSGSSENTSVSKASVATTQLFNSAINSFVSQMAGSKPSSDQQPSSNNNSNTNSNITEHFVGLSNQGATCYLNSLIQSLYHTPEFRRMILEWRYNPDKDPSKERCIPYQLQRLFAYLALSKRKAVPTTHLTKSFGWTQSDAFVQHDVQELNRILFDAIDVSLATDKLSQENPMEGKQEIGKLAHFENILISEMYSGIMIDYIEAKDERRENGQPYGRVREDLYMDLQLVVRGISSVEEALDSYIKPEIMDGDNQWICEELQDKKVDAVKGLKFKTIPYIFTLHLKRFDYDYTTWNRIKLGNMVTFPFELDVSKYLEDNTQNAIYELFGVLVHSGTSSGGHYYAYIKSFSSDKWYNFNDSNVSEIDREQVKVMFGNNDSSSTGRFASSTNAYMLLYRKRDEKLNINSVDMSIIPEDLKEEVEKDNEQIEEEVRKSEELRSNITIRVKSENQPILNLSVKKTDTMQQVLEKVYEAMSKRENFFTRFHNCRLRKYDIMKQTPTSSFQNHADQPISRFCHFNGALIYLETKESDEEWKEIAETISVYICPFNQDINEFDQPRSLKITTVQTLDEIKMRIEEELQREKYPHEKINLVISRGDEVIIFHNEEERSKSIESGLNIANTDLIYVEALEDPLQNVESKIIQKLEEMKYCFDILVNTIESPNDYTTSVTVDKRTTVGDLKKKIADMMKVGVDDFRLCSKTRFQPIKENLLISECSEVFEYCQLHVEKGQALKDGEYIIQLYVHLPWLSEQLPQESRTEVDINPDKMVAEPSPDCQVMTCEPPPSSTALVLAAENGPVYNPSVKLLDRMNKLKEEMRLVDKVVISAQETLGSFKQRIFEKYFSDPESDQFVPLELMRLRMKLGVFFQKILINDEKTLKENIPDLANNKQIVVQFLEKPENLKEGDLTIKVQRWQPLSWSFYGGSDAKFEVIIPKQQEPLTPQVFRSLIYNALKDTVLSDVPPERVDQIGISRAPHQFDYFIIKECIQVAILNYEEIDTLKDLHKPPFILAQDDIMIIRLKDELDKYDMTELKTKRASAPSSTGRVEKALKINVIDKETEQKEEEERKKQQEQQQASSTSASGEQTTVNGGDKMVDDTAPTSTGTEENPKKKMKSDE